jgi:hypothetical protein
MFIVTLFSEGYEYDKFTQFGLIISAVTHIPDDITLSFWQQVDAITAFRSYTKSVSGIRAQSFPLPYRILTANMVKYHSFTFQTKSESESYRQPEDEPFLPSGYSQHKTRNAWHTYFTAFHVILTTVLAFVCLGLLVKHHPSKLGTYETGFNTELSMSLSRSRFSIYLIMMFIAAILPSIELETRTFHFVTSAEEGSHREYVGSRTPDIDHAWNRLLHCELSGLGSNDILANEYHSCKS